MTSSTATLSPELAAKYGHCFGAFDLRAIVDERFDATTFYGLGLAWAQLIQEQGQVKGQSVIVGHDARVTRIELSQALIEGLIEGGFNVTNIGLGPTPLVSFAEIASHKGLPGFEEKAAGGIMVTASHNPSPYNGMKFTINALPPSREVMARFKELYLELRAAGYTYKPKILEEGATYKKVDAYPLYLDEVMKQFEPVAKGLRIVLDGSNGSGGPLFVKMLERLGAEEIIELFTEPDGTFPNHSPDPSNSANLAQLCDKVRETKANFGFALDGDADRLASVDENGEVISNDVLLALFAKGIDPKNVPNGLSNNVICEIKSPAALMAGLEKQGFVPQLSKTGHVFMKESMKTFQASVGGEYSGHFFFKDEHPGYDDPLYAACRLLRLWQETAKAEGKAPADVKLSEMVVGLLPNTIISDEYRLPCPKEKSPVVVEALQKDLDAGVLTLPIAVKQIHRLDGIRVDLEGGFVLVRPSNTEPIISIRFEALDQASFDALEKALFAWLAQHIDVNAKSGH